MRDFIEAYIIFALALALLVYGCASGVFDYKKCDRDTVEVIVIESNE